MSRLLRPLLLKNRRFWGWFVPKNFQRDHAYVIIFWKKKCFLSSCPHSHWMSPNVCPINIGPTSRPHISGSLDIGPISMGHTVQFPLNHLDSDGENSKTFSASQVVSSLKCMNECYFKCLRNHTLPGIIMRISNCMAQDWTFLSEMCFKFSNMWPLAKGLEVNVAAQILISKKKHDLTWNFGSGIKFWFSAFFSYHSHRHFILYMHCSESSQQVITFLSPRCSPLNISNTVFPR